ncbi:MAG: glycosyltransferase [Hyphomicrobiaceae bacterium]
MLIQVVPHRTSAPDGIGDYAVNLATELRDRFDVQTLFVAGAPPGEEVDRADEWPTLRVATRKSEALIDVLRKAVRQAPNASLVLHISGYGYAPRGAPVWLARGIQSWRARNPQRCTIGIFHELYAKGPITSSSFWLSGLQKRVTKILWNNVDAAITTTPTYVAQLASWRPTAEARIIELPVPSTIGEPASIPLYNERKNRAVVFGRNGVEDLIYRQNRDQLIDALVALGVEEILDIGLRRAHVPETLGPISIKALGRLDANEISKLMLTSRFGVLSYDQKRLGKSTIFAAFASHGVVPICIGASEPSQAAPERGKHFLASPIGAATEIDLQSIQRALLIWYRTHDQAALSTAIARLIQAARDD